MRLKNLITSSCLLLSKLKTNGNIRQKACSKSVLQVGIETSFIKLPISFALEYRVFCVMIVALFVRLAVLLIDKWIF